MRVKSRPIARSVSPGFSSGQICPRAGDSGNYQGRGYKELAIFTKVFRTPYYGLSMEGNLKVGALLQFFQEAAALHADSAGIGVRDMLERGATWVLRRYRIKIHHLPAMEDLTVRTWFEPRKNIISVRLFDRWRKRENSGIRVVGGGCARSEKDAPGAPRPRFAQGLLRRGGAAAGRSSRHAR